MNFLAEEPGGGRDRLFVNDLNGPLYILNKTTKSFSTYLNFNGREDTTGVVHPGMFEEFVFESGYANGLITMQFDPDYANNGKFYTVHMEDPAVLSGNNDPKNTVSYTTTTNITPGAGGNTRQTVLLEWTDTNINNTTFEGSARELLRMSMSGQIHPMGDIAFNPNVHSGDADWRMMYISVGDGGAGESGSSSTRLTPQRLDSLGGKVLRIRADNVGAGTAVTASPNGQYYIPDDNPFTGISNSAVRDEIWTLGHRNVHRLSWDAPTDTLIVDEIGLHSWEEVNIVHKGANYGYSSLEGNQVLDTNNSVNGDPLPANLPLRITNTVNAGSTTIAPTYPAAQYGHDLSGQTGFAGDSVSSGYVYRGTNIPSLYGKYIFGEITTGQMFWCDFDEMLTDEADADPNTMAEIHAIDLAWDNPADAAAEVTYSTTTNGTNPSRTIQGPMFKIVRAGYVARGGTDSNLPGSAAVTGSGRADIRLQIDEAGELFLLSKSDGMIRYITEAIGKADFNGDTKVDGTDFLIWQRNLGASGGLSQGDADGDGKITAADLSFWTAKSRPARPPCLSPPRACSRWAHLWR